jgi:phage repressor protein C with HTH and peptisase S24 domain
MLPRIHDGDAILFNRAQTGPVNHKLFVIQIDGVTGQFEPQVKKCRIIGGQVYFEALNKSADPFWKDERPMIDKRHPIEILGRVRWIGSWED